jgi:hypothetical protein
MVADIGHPQPTAVDQPIDTALTPTEERLQVVTGIERLGEAEPVTEFRERGRIGL